MTVQFALESVSSLAWNHCPVCRGIGVQFAVEYADDMATKLDIEFYQDGRDALLKALAA